MKIRNGSVETMKKKKKKKKKGARKWRRPFISFLVMYQCFLMMLNINCFISNNV